jgi:hypothetical protein
LLLDEYIQGLLDKIIARLMKMLTRVGYLVEEQGMTYLADIDADNPLKALQAASCTYRIALGPRAGQKVLSLQTVASGDENTKSKRTLCTEAHGFSLHAAVRCGARAAMSLYHPPRDRQRTPEPQCHRPSRITTRERLAQRHNDIVISLLEFMQRPAMMDSSRGSSVAWTYHERY